METVCKDRDCTQGCRRYARVDKVCKDGDSMQGWRQYARVKTMLGKQEGQRLMLRHASEHGF